MNLPPKKKKVYIRYQTPPLLFCSLTSWVLVCVADLFLLLFYDACPHTSLAQQYIKGESNNAFVCFKKNWRSKDHGQSFQENTSPPK